MRAVPPPAGPAGRPDVRRGDQTVILLCSDVSDTGPCPVPAAEIAAAVRARAPWVRVLTVLRLCSWPVGLPAALRSLLAHRAVVGCRHGTARRGEITAMLRRAGIPGRGISVVDLMPAGHPDPSGVARQSAARLRAAAAIVARADLDAPFRARADGAAMSFSRRALFHPAAMADAMSLAGWSLPGLEAAAGELAAEALRPGPGRVHGVAITCVRATRRLPVGADWLPLEVPSLEMVSTGWPLRILSTGTGVAFAACDDAGCASRARELDQFCADRAGAAAAGWHRLDTTLGGWAPASPGQWGPAGETLAAPLRLREPEASAQVGDITIDAGRCSACGCCARACPTGALTASYQNDPALILLADTARCTACGDCVRACPEGAVSVRRTADSARLATGRRVVASVTAGARCESCGQPLAGGLSGEAVALRIAASHPRVAARLRHESRCADCLLKARNTAASGSRPPGPAP